MNTESRAHYLRSQIFFAALSAIPWAIVGFLSVAFFRLAPLLCVLVLLYGLAAGYVGFLWLRALQDRSASPVVKFGSIALWSIPFAACAAAILALIVSAFDDRPDAFNDVEYQPLSLLPIPIMALVWFGTPLLFAILYARKTTTTDKTPNPEVSFRRGPE